MTDMESRLAAMEARIAELEDHNAIRRLQNAYGYYIDYNRPEEVTGLFSEDGAVVFLSGGLSNGTYQHYFQLVLSPVDVLYSLAKAIIFVIITSIIQCYYGFYASGGPQGVGTAAGRAMRAAISAMIVANLIATILFWGIDSAARLSG